VGGTVATELSNDQMTLAFESTASAISNFILQLETYFQRKVFGTGDEK